MPSTNWSLVLGHTSVHMPEVPSHVHFFQDTGPRDTPTRVCTCVVSNGGSLIRNPHYFQAYKA